MPWRPIRCHAAKRLRRSAWAMGAMREPWACRYFGRYRDGVVPSPPAPVLIFEDDDAGHVAWTRAHRRGFVVNTSRPPSASYLMLHWADCRDISGRSEAWISGGYLKACGPAVSDLAQWASTETGGELTRCAHCWA